MHLIGEYAFSEQGLIEGVGDAVEIGTLQINRDGTATGNSILNTPIGIFQVSFDNGKVTVDANCSGSASFETTLSTYPDGFPLPNQPQPRSLAFVFTRSGELRFISTVPGNRLIGSASKTSR